VINESYLRSKFEEKSDDLSVWKAGHYIILIRYSLTKGCPIFCINKKTFEADIKTINDYLATAESKDLAAVVNEADREFFQKEFFQYGFTPI